MRWVRSVGAAVGVALLSSAVALPAASATTVAVPVPAVTGPDVSVWQHPYGAAIDWTKVRTAGHSFAIIKASEGTWPSTWIGPDTAGARAAGLVTGGYAFARPALPLSTATAQARVLVAALGDVHRAGTLPPVLDLETTGGLVPRDLVAWAQTFLETVRSLTGRTPIVYTYRYFWTSSMAGSTAFTRYPLWLAAYTSTPPVGVGGTPWSLWQYTSSGAVPGIRGGVDISRFAGTTAQLAALADGTATTSWPLVAPQAPVRSWAEAGNRSATVKWIPGDDGGARPTSWTVTRYPGGVAQTVSGTATSTIVAGLAPGVAYRFTVRARSPRGSSPTTAPTVAVVPGRTPSVPTALTAVAGSTGIALHWAGSVGSPTSWVVSRCAPAPCSPTATRTTVGGLGLLDRAVTPGTTYAYAVQARNQWGTSARSAIVTTRAFNPLPLAPVSAALSSTSTVVGRSVVLAGRTTSRAAGATVIRQGYYSGAWHTWATAPVSSTGGYRFVVTPTVRTVNTYRVVLPAASWHATSVSPTLSLRVG